MGRGSSTLSCPLKYGGSVAFPWSFMDKKRKTSYILRRHCINACYSCSAFVELIFLSFYPLWFPVSLSPTPAPRCDRHFFFFFVLFLLYRRLSFSRFYTIRLQPLFSYPHSPFISLPSPALPPREALCTRFTQSSRYNLLIT